MRKTSLLAWLLIAAMLALSCPAYGEALDVELADDIAGDAMAAEPAAGFPREDTLDVELDLPAGDLDMDLPEIGLDGDLLAADAALPDALADGDAVWHRVIDLQGQGIADNDALFAGYVDMLFGKSVQKNGYIGDTLTGTARKIFDYMAPEIKKVAMGRRTDTVFVVPVGIAPGMSEDQYWSEVLVSMYAMLADFPYHLYWFDKEHIDADYNDDQLILPLPVAQEYAAGPFETNKKKILAAQTAVINAKNVVCQYAGASDYEKLCGYRDYICDAVEYNWGAASDPSMPYGNPWQLIWTFDGDPDTNVVCEGYAKAFQYLCDLTSFDSDIRAYSVFGCASHDLEVWGAHMWNIVTMEDGKNYHVDVTWYDGGERGDFLAGTPNAAEKGGAFSTANGRAHYRYEEDTFLCYPVKLLKLAKRDYDPAGAAEVRSVRLKKAGKTLKKGQEIKLKRGKSLTLKAVVSPGGAKTTLTWKSSCKHVAVKDGRVTAGRKAEAGTRAKITVTTSNGKSTYVYIVVK